MNKKIYVTGHITDISPKTIQKDLDQLHLICRRIIVTKNIPICPTILYHNYPNDPRFTKDPAWWVENLYLPHLHTCDLFCYIPTPATIKSVKCELEKDLWMSHKQSRPIDSGVIFEYLLNENLARIAIGDLNE